MVETGEKTLSPKEVRNILNADNKEIVELCKQASILPKKNTKGQTYFSYDEVKHLRQIQSQKFLPAERPNSAITNILNSIRSMEETLSDKIAKVIDEKLEGMDEVVVELIRCKTDNETLKQKIIDLNKEMYQLKNDLNSYKHVGLGLYKKKERHVWE
ncbi:MAG: hypothetical protein E7Z93_05010 [Cyanobacteria bacterium SIG32]|nr:hypothetical protein [Cyanobacteria bacterium SIG32]